MYRLDPLELQLSVLHSVRLQTQRAPPIGYVNLLQNFSDSQRH
jgi:hypothetical protein